MDYMILYILIDLLIHFVGGVFVGNLFMVFLVRWKNYRNYFLILWNIRKIQLRCHIQRVDKGYYLSSLNTGSEVITIHYNEQRRFLEIENHTREGKIEIVKMLQTIRFILIHNWIIDLLCWYLGNKIRNTPDILEVMSVEEMENEVRCMLIAERRKVRINSI
jgi:hypothetical protein